LLFLFFFLDTQHVSGNNMSIFRSLRLLLNYHIGCFVLGLLPASAGSLDTTLDEPYPNSNTQQTKNETANVVDKQYRRKLLKMDILMPETCWVSRKKNTNSKWHLVGFSFFSYHKMHGPVNIRCHNIYGHNHFSKNEATPNWLLCLKDVLSSFHLIQACKDQVGQRKRQGTFT